MVFGLCGLPPYTEATCESKSACAHSVSAVGSRSVISVYTTVDDTNPALPQGP